MNVQPYTSKQMGDACEMLIAGELTLAGIPATKMPDNWPSYDVIAQPKNVEAPQRISVKSRTFSHGSGNFITYKANDQFDWLAIVLLPGADQLKRRFFVVPRAIADDRARRDRPTAMTNELYFRPKDIPERFSDFEDNFRLNTEAGCPKLQL